MWLKFQSVLLYLTQSSQRKETSKVTIHHLQSQYDKRSPSEIVFSSNFLYTIFSGKNNPNSASCILSTDNIIHYTKYLNTLP